MRNRKNPVDAQVEAIYYRNAQGKSINIMDIGKVFDAGRGAAKRGEDIEAAVIAAIGKYCQ